MYNISYIRQWRVVIGQYMRESNETIFAAVYTYSWICVTLPSLLLEYGCLRKDCWVIRL